MGTGFLRSCAHLCCQHSLAGGMLELLLLIPARPKVRRSAKNKKLQGRNVSGSGSRLLLLELDFCASAWPPSTCLSPAQKCAQMISQLNFFLRSGRECSGGSACTTEMVGGSCAPGSVGTCSPAVCRNELQSCCLDLTLNIFIFSHQYN